MTKQIDLEAEIQRLLAEHDRVAEQGVTVQRRENVLVLSGEVESEHRRDEICRQITARYPDLEIACDIGITRTHAPDEVEEIS
ncbi:hypothetical protein Acy02nite_23950 [Actinoplanes cyaneus]|jgi:hypothetical protein|uniref:BON domain-containing protein n=1 Tax=Actinoplanes cyaneus TaxID=52696 RepID=A0A919IF62_9ACTN|nr:hypothetical protein [Actinoplanes cyaneus]MCW2136340.1 hypothetical protein [Actinoplanes cyaneus]GID64514.1 hypothetical protein Acy02nite_23950 [Actinoplanes cyaneus]